MHFVFLFVNPKSGDESGRDLVYHLKHAPYTVEQRWLWVHRNIQVFLVNHGMEEDRDWAATQIRFLQEHGACLAMVQSNRPLLLACERQQRCPVHHSAAGIHAQLLTAAPFSELDTQPQTGLHVISAGGDGTFSWIVDSLWKQGVTVFENGVAAPLPVHFSFVPLGTGNDLSQYAGYGRTVQFHFGRHHRMVPRRLRDPTDLRLLRNLEDVVVQRVENSEPRWMDFWTVCVQVYPGGFIRKGSKVSELGYAYVPLDQHQMQQRMTSCFAIGAMGSVGVEFEKKRSKNRWRNLVRYTLTSFRTFFLRRLPSITDRIACIQVEGHPPVLGTELTPAIDMIIQNIPGIWGRNINLWSAARNVPLSLPPEFSPDHPGNPASWTSPSAGDGKVEIFCIRNTFSYLRKQFRLFRHHLTRVGQFPGGTTVHFHPPSSPTSTGRGYSKEQLITCMIDGEFYEIHKPQAMRLEFQGKVRVACKPNSRLANEELEE